MDNEERRERREKIFKKVKLSPSEYIKIFTETYQVYLGAKSEEEAERLAIKEFETGRKKGMWKLLRVNPND